MPKRRVHPKPLQQPHPPIWGATSSLEGHYEIGVRGLGLLSFTVGMPPEELEARIVNYRKGLSECTEPVGRFVNPTAATFTMVHCNDTSEALKGEQAGFFDHLTMDYLYDSGAGVVGDPDRCIELCKRYEAVGCELLFCLLNPYNIPHEEVMRSIELIGKHVIPELDR